MIGVEMGEDQVRDFIEIQPGLLESNNGVAHAVDQQNFLASQESEVGILMLRIGNSRG
jgi:hypothetical protein